MLEKTQSATANVFFYIVDHLSDLTEEELGTLISKCHAELNARENEK